VEAEAKITHDRSLNSIKVLLVSSGSDTVGNGAGRACDVLGIADGRRRQGGKMPEEAVSQFLAVGGRG